MTDFGVVLPCEVFGRRGVGKTNLINRFLGEAFDSRHMPTARGEEWRETIRELHGKRIKLRIWEVLNFLSLGKNLLVYDVTSKKSFLHLSKESIKEIKWWRDRGYSQVLVGNKCDQESRREVSQQDGRDLARRLGIPFFETSSKENININKAFLTLIENFMINNGDIPESLKAKLHYQRAVRSGSVPVIRSRLVVVGPDGAGKTSFIGSLLGRKFKEDRPSTDGVAIEIAVTEADDKWKEESCDGLRYFDKQIARATAFQIEQPEEIPVRADTARVDRKSSTEEPNYTVPATKSISFPADIGMRPSTSSFRRFLQSFQRKKSLSLKNSQAESSQEKQETVTERRSEGKTQRQLPEIPNKALPVDVGLSKRQEKILSSNATMVLLKYLRTKHIWDLGGQETYLATHAALLSLEGTFTVTAYALVFDLTKSLKDQARSYFRDSDGNVQDLTHDLSVIRQYGDFLRHWLTSLQIAYPRGERRHFLGVNEGVEFPPVFGVATHADVPGAIKKLPDQIQAFAEIFKEMDYQEHLIDPRKDGQESFYLISNSLSSECPGIQTLRRRLDAMDEDYWSRQEPMPVRWLAFEELLVTWKESKVMNLRSAVDIGTLRCGIPGEEEVIAALQYLHNLGVIQYFSSVPFLSQHVFIDPVWLAKSIAAFVTAKQPSLPRLMPDWDALKTTGKMSARLTRHCLSCSGSHTAEEHESILKALEMIDVAYQSQSSESGTLFIPSMIKSKFRGRFLFKEYDPDGRFPPPVVIQPKRVPAIPESFYFRLIVRFLREFHKFGGVELSRNCCRFCTAPRMRLELFYHPRGQCIIATVGGDFSGTSTDDVAALCRTREFLLQSMAEAKLIGMKGLQYSVSCHLASFLARKLRHPDRLDGSDCVFPKTEYTVCLDGYEPDGIRSLFTDDNRFLDKSLAPEVLVWFGRPMACSRSVQSMSCQEAQELANKVKTSGCFPSPVGFSECPYDIIHIVCQSSIDLSVLKGHLGIGSGDLSRRPKQETEYGKARDIIDVWIHKRGPEATLDVLFNAVESSGQFGTVRESVKELIIERQKYV